MDLHMCSQRQTNQVTKIDYSSVVFLKIKRYKCIHGISNNWDT